MSCRRLPFIAVLAFALLAMLQTGCSSSAKGDKDGKGGDGQPGQVKDEKGNPIEDPREAEFVRLGGNRESARAVDLGLRWLDVHQARDGSWSLMNFSRDGNCNCDGAAMENKVAATSFALLPFVAAGFTHQGSEQRSQYIKLVDNGVRALVRMQKPDGDLMGDANMYTHGLATITLCELYNMTANDPILKDPCNKAIRFIIDAQHDAGGWRYKPRMEGDLSVVSWQLMALKSGQMAGISVPEDTLRRADRFLESVSLPDGGYFYRVNEKGQNEFMDSRPAHPAVMTAAGMLCRQYLRGKKDLHGNMDLASPELVRGIHHITNNPPREDVKNIYYYYYATQVLFNIGGPDWESWNQQMRDMLIRTQDQGREYEHQRGSWSPRGDQFQGQGGRIMTTSLALLTLEVYYRYLPLNKKYDLGIMSSSPSSR